MPIAIFSGTPARTRLWTAVRRKSCGIFVGYPAAVQEFTQANQQDPRILYMTALAWQGAGDGAKASAFAAKAAKFNGLSFNSAYVKSKAGKISTSF